MGVVVYRRTGSPEDVDAIDQYSRRLVDALATSGVRARYEPGGLSRVATGGQNHPDWVALQYNPFRYGRAGFAPTLLSDALALKRAAVPLVVMVHEAWVKMADWRLTLMGLWQRLQLRGLIRLADAMTTSTEALAHEIGAGSVHVPVAANIAPVGVSRTEARDLLGLDDLLTVTLFGRAHPSRALDYAEDAIAALAESRGSEKLAVLNLGADAPMPKLPSGIRLISPGRQDERQLSLGLTASDVVLLPFVDGVSTRRGTLMAALAHGRPIARPDRREHRFDPGGQSGRDHAHPGRRPDRVRASGDRPRVGPRATSSARRSRSSPLRVTVRLAGAGTQRDWSARLDHPRPPRRRDGQDVSTSCDPVVGLPPAQAGQLLRIGVYTSSLQSSHRKPPGVDVFVDRLAEHLARRGHEVTVFTYTPATARRHTSITSWSRKAPPHRASGACSSRRYG